MTSRDQLQQHGVGGVDTEAIQAGIERLYKADFVGRGWLATWTADIGTLCDDYERLQAQVAQLTEERQREREVGTLEHARQHVSCGVVIAAKENEIESLRARCASLEAVIKQLIAVAEDDNGIEGDDAWNDAFTDARVVLDQHATTTQEGTHA